MSAKPVARVGQRHIGPEALPPCDWRRQLKHLARAMLLVTLALAASTVIVFFHS